MMGWFILAMMAGSLFKFFETYGVVDRVKRHHIWSHLLVQNDFVRQQHVSKWAKGDWGQLVVAN